MAHMSETTRSRSDAVETRTVITPRGGARLAVIVGVLFAIAGIYQLISPHFIQTGAGVLNCGTGLSTPAEEFTRNICAGINKSGLYSGAALLLAALVTPYLGMRLYGVDRKEVEQPVDDDLDED